MYLNETCVYSRVWVGKHWSEMFPIRNGLKQGDALSPFLLQAGFTVRHLEDSGIPEWLEIKWYPSASGLCR